MNINGSSIFSLFKFKQKRVESPAELANDYSKGSSETVFVKHVKDGGPAYLAGLREGDCPVSINNVPLGDKQYTNVIPIIENR